MAIFRVGQRVRFTGKTSDFLGGLGLQVKAGDCGTIIHKDPRGWRDWSVQFDGLPRWVGADNWQLAPLTDPKADEFIESVKKWGPLHEEPKRIETLGDLLRHAKEQLQR